MIAGTKSIRNTRTDVAVPYADSGMSLRHCAKSTGVVPPTALLGPCAVTNTNTNTLIRRNQCLNRVAITTIFEPLEAITAVSSRIEPTLSL